MPTSTFMTGNTLIPFTVLNKYFLKMERGERGFTCVLVHSTPTNTYKLKRTQRRSKLDTKPYLSSIDFVAILVYVKLEIHFHQTFYPLKPPIKCQIQTPKSGYKTNKIVTRRIKYLLGQTESSCQGLTERIREEDKQWPGL